MIKSFYDLGWEFNEALSGAHYLISDYGHDMLMGRCYKLNLHQHDMDTKRFYLSPNLTVDGEKDNADD